MRVLQRSHCSRDAGLCSARAGARSIFGSLGNGVVLRAAVSEADAPPRRPACIEEEEGAVTVRDDMNSLLTVLPADVRECLVLHPRRADLLEIVLDVGRRPEARFLGGQGGEELRATDVTYDELARAEASLGEFGADNRAGIEGTLHRISAIRNRRGRIVGLTCRVGRAVTGHVDMVRHTYVQPQATPAMRQHLTCLLPAQIRDLLSSPESILFLGRPGVGKTTVIRELARVLADECHRRVVIIGAGTLRVRNTTGGRSLLLSFTCAADTSSEIGGDGDVPHPAVGGARRMQVANPSEQHRLMIEAVENHMPEIVIVDEVSTEAEALACRTIAERGVQLVATAHGQVLANLLKNPTLSDLVGGVQSVTLGDDEARARGTQKTIMERKGPPTFPTIIEMRERSLWVAHDTQTSVDDLLLGRTPMVEVRSRGADRQVVISSRPYDVESSVGVRRGVQDDEPGSPAWALRIGAVHDKDALLNATLNNLYGGGPSSGKRGGSARKTGATAAYGRGSRSGAR